MKTIQPLLLIVISAIIVYFYALPQWNKITALRVRNVEIINALSKADELAQLRSQLVAQYEAIPDEDVAKLARVAPSVYEPVKLIADINALALNYGLLIRNIRIVDQQINDAQAGVIQGAVPVEGPYTKKQLSFTTQGQYRNFVSFLGDIEKSLQLLDIETIEISNAQVSTKSGASDGLDFEVTLHTYWMK